MRRSVEDGPHERDAASVRGPGRISVGNGVVGEAPCAGRRGSTTNNSSSRSALRRAKSTVCPSRSHTGPSYAGSAEPTLDPGSKVVRGARPGPRRPVATSGDASIAASRSRPYARRRRAGRPLVRVRERRRSRHRRATRQDGRRTRAAAAASARVVRCRRTRSGRAPRGARRGCVLRTRSSCRRVTTSPLSSRAGWT